MTAKSDTTTLSPMGKQVITCMRDAVRKVFAANRRTGVGLAIWKNGKVVIVGRRKTRRTAKAKR